MAVLKQLLAFAVAALVANPVCCCTAGMVFDHFGQQDSGPACCGAKTPGNPHPAPPQDDDPPCPCDKDPSVLVEAKVTHIDSVSGCEAAPSLRAELRAVPPPCTPDPILPATADLPPPPRPWRLYCRFLL